MLLISRSIAFAFWVAAGIALALKLDAALAQSDETCLQPEYICNLMEATQKLRLEEVARKICAAQNAAIRDDRLRPLRHSLSTGRDHGSTQPRNARLRARRIEKCVPAAVDEGGDW